MSKTVDDIVFAIGKAGSDVGFGGGLTKVVKNFDPTSIVAGVGRGNFFKNLSLPEIPLSSSKLFHTPDVLSNLKHVDIDDLVPKNTGDLIKGLGKNADDVVLSSTDDFAAALAKTTDDIDINPDALKGIVKASSLRRLKVATDDIAAMAAETAAKKSDIIGGVGGRAIKNADEFAEATGDSVAGALKKTNFKNTDEMADSLKSSSGYAKHADEVGGEGLEAGARGAKKKSGVFWDEAADDVVRNDNWGKLTKHLDAHGGKINFGIFAAFMFSRHINGNAPWSSTEVEEELGDPIEADEIEEIQYTIDVEDIVRNHVPEETFLESDGFAFAVVAATVAFMSL